MGWAGDKWKVQVMLLTPQVICLKCLCIRSGKEIIISFVYGKNQESERRLLWYSLETISSNINSLGIPWMVLGDFYSVRHYNEKVGGQRVNSAWIDRFNTCIIQSGLVDLNTKGMWLMWTNRQRGTGRILGRIDRAIVNGN